MFRAYLGLIRKEFIQVRRDPNLLRLVFAIPIIQLLLLGYAVNLDVKNVALDVYDFDHSQESRKLIEAFRAGGYFLPDETPTEHENFPLWKLDTRFENGSADMAMIIPSDFAERIQVGDNTSVSLQIDGADANQGRIGMGYAALFVNHYASRARSFQVPVQLREKFLYNPESESVYFMVPGIVATLLTMVTVMLTSMAIVREREMGTLEQVMVTPISTFVLLMGKVTTFAILGMIEMTVALVVGILWFGVPFAGSPFLLFVLSGLYLFTALGIGMFFSNVTTAQQQAMFLAWFFSVFAILTSGFFTPISNMPHWMQMVTYINPMRYFVVIVRGIMMKGSGFVDLLPQVAVLTGFGLSIFTFSLLRFQKRIQ